MKTELDAIVISLYGPVMSASVDADDCLTFCYNNNPVSKTCPIQFHDCTVTNCFTVLFKALVPIPVRDYQSINHRYK